MTNQTTKTTDEAKDPKSNDRASVAASAFTSVRVFSATRPDDRAMLGERITEWITSRQGAVEIVDIIVRQSSDTAFHMLSVTIFFNEPGKPRIDHAIKAPATSSSVRRLNFRDD